MYRACIFCSADLKANDALERFPVGRSLAFDAAKGRLWAICPRCARWNLAPLEERWEAIEDAERLFRDTRTRAQRENIGLARLPDGTRLVRVGDALRGELAAWRYGETLARRRVRDLVTTGVGIVTVGGLVTAGVVAAGITLTGVQLLLQGAHYARETWTRRRPLARLSAEETGHGEAAVIHRKSLPGVVLSRAEDGDLRLIFLGAREVETPVAAGITSVREKDLIVQGDAARRVLARTLVHVNNAGANRVALRHALEILAAVPSPSEYVRRLADQRIPLGPARHPLPHQLALEMALHEATERRALEGELAALEEMWRQAEEIAAIADRLPDASA